MLSSLVVQRPFSCKKQGAAVALAPAATGRLPGRPRPLSPLHPAQRHGTAPPPSRCAAAGRAPRQPFPLRSRSPRPVPPQRPAAARPGTAAVAAPPLPAAQRCWLRRGNTAATAGMAFPDGEPLGVPIRRRPKPLLRQNTGLYVSLSRARCLGRWREPGLHKRVP